MIAGRHSMLQGGMVEVEYLEGSASAYIDTGVLVSPGIGYHVVESASNGICQFGAYSGSGNRFVYFGRVAVVSIGDRKQITFYPVTRATLADNAYRYTVDHSSIYEIWGQSDESAGNALSASISIDGMPALSGSYSSTWPAGSSNCYLFASRSSTGAVAGSSIVRIYEAQIYWNGVMVRDYVPVKAGNTGFMLERISGSLIGPEGGGQFGVGPVKGPVPYDSQVEYIMSDLNSCVILHPENLDMSTFAMETKVAKTGSTTNRGWYYMDVRGYNGVAEVSGSYCIGNTSAVDSYFTDTEKYGTMSWSASLGKGTCGETSTEISKSYTSSSNPAGQGIYLSCFFRVTGGQPDPYPNDRGKYKYFKIWSGGELLYDLWPVRIGQTAYLYNRVDKELYGNSLSGSLLYGQDI